ncbi:MAG: SurA N-terminal domain-containing protein [Elusimicrobiaceae bacterium]|nr:SurA N-terminal domain-containing protein [Elusimicrobiaceae bacterium]MBQ6223683.1 SurA N-terminal domain-containing protein [Campylobacter sp.]
MISFFIRFKNIILIAIIVCFLGSLGYVGVGAVNEAYGPNAPIAKVGKENIKYRDYDRALKNAYQTIEAQDTQEADDLIREQLKQEVLQGLISQSTLKQAALELGLGVSDMETAYTIKNSPLFNITGSFNKDTYLWIIRNRLGMNPEEFEQEVKNGKLAENFQKVLIYTAKVSPQEEEFIQKTIFKGKDTEKEQFILLKAQTLANNFLHDFNQSHQITFTKLAPNYQDQEDQQKED